MREVEMLRNLPELRSLLKLYSSIHVEKLSALAKLSVENLITTLIVIKYKSQQFLRKSEVTNLGTEKKTAAVSEFFHTDGVFESVSNLHFYIENHTIAVDEKQRKQKFAEFFLQNAMRLGQCATDIKTNSASKGGKGRIMAYGKRKGGSTRPEKQRG